MVSLNMKNKWKILNEKGELFEICRGKVFAKNYIHMLKNKTGNEYTYVKLSDKEFKYYNSEEWLEKNQKKE